MEGLPMAPSGADRVLNWVRRHSLQPLVLGGDCCAAEVVWTLGQRFGLAHFDPAGLLRPPSHADLLIVASRISLKLAPLVRRVYEQIPAPRWVMAVGACAVSGGVFDTYATVPGVDKLIPVDVYVPGCPPQPEALLEALEVLRRKIEKQRRPGKKGRRGEE